MNHRHTHHTPNRPLDSIELGELTRRFKDVFIDVLKAHQGALGILLLLAAIPSFLIKAFKWLLLVASSGNPLLFALGTTFGGNIDMLLTPLTALLMISSFLFVGILVRRKLLAGAPNTSGSMAMAMAKAALCAPFVSLMIFLYTFGGLQCCVLPGLFAYFILWPMRYTALVQGLGFFRGLVRSIETSKVYFIPLLGFHTTMLVGGFALAMLLALLGLIDVRLNLPITTTSWSSNEAISFSTIGGLVAVDMIRFGITLVLSVFVWFVELALMITIEEHRSLRNAG